MRYQIDTIKISLVKEDIGEKVCSESKAYQVFNDFYKTLDADQEHFSILIVDNKNQIRGLKMLFTGGESSSLIDYKVVFRTALLMGAVGLIVCHNHPSGECYPSNEDLKVTIQLKEGAELLGLKLLDHLVLGHNEVYSFKDKGLL